MYKKGNKSEKKTRRESYSVLKKKTKKTKISTSLIVKKRIKKNNYEKNKKKENM